MSIGRCLGCNQEKELIEAHIIPKSWRNRLNPPKNKNPKELNKPTFFIDEELLHKKGKNNFDIANLPVDSNILCESCDNGILKKYDDELYKVWQYWIEHRHEYDTNNEIEIPVSVDLTIKGVAAILWRSSISKIEELSHINLGSECNNLFREFLFEKRQLKDNDFFGVITLYLPSNPRRINEYEIEDPSLAMSSKVNTCKYRNCNIFYKIMLPSIWIDALIGNPDNEDINSPLIWSANKNKIFAEIVEFDGS